MNTNDAQDLTKLLLETINVFKEDRKLAKDNYDALRTQLDNILDKDLEGSEEYRLEAAVNMALKLVFASAERLESVVESITKITIANLTNESRERVAQTFIGGGGNYGNQPIVGKVDISALLAEKEE